MCFLLNPGKSYARAGTKQRINFKWPNAMFLQAGFDLSSTVIVVMESVKIVCILILQSEQDEMMKENVFVVMCSLFACSVIIEISHKDRRGFPSLVGNYQGIILPQGHEQYIRQKSFSGIICCNLIYSGNVY